MRNEKEIKGLLKKTRTEYKDFKYLLKTCKTYYDFKENNIDIYKVDEIENIYQNTILNLEWVLGK